MSEELPEGAAALDELRRKRDAGEASTPTALQLQNLRLLDADLSELDLSGSDFSGSDLSGANFSSSRLAGAKLNGCVLHGACLDDAELLGAELSGADLTEASAERAGFGHTTLTDAKAFALRADGASFSSAQLQRVDLRTAQLAGARLREAQLSEAVLENCALREADMVDAEVSGASFRNADLREARFRGLRGYRTTDWVGADVRNVDFAGAWLVRRHILDENFLAEFRSQSPTHEKLYQLWWLTSDCGRSLYRWGLFAFAVAVLYAILYSFPAVGIHYGDHPTLLSPLYFSIVTFTTLGYGDILPTSLWGQVLVITEVVLGYVGLGGLLSILANKLARRAG